MNQHPTYRKTAKGAAAILSRVPGLIGRLRSLLILVDGKRAGEELRHLASGFGDVGQLLGELERDGYIEPVPGTLSAPAAPVKAPTTLADAKKFASHRLMQVLGPTSEPMCLKIETAPNMAEFVALVKRACVIVREVRGVAEAVRFGDSVEANLPPR